MTGYETFCLYLAMKNHFTRDSYDFFKYNGKVKHTSKETYLARRDRFQFEKLARKVPNNMMEHMIANFLQDRAWVGDLLSDEAFDATTAYMKKVQSMSYIFKSEVDCYDNLNDLFKKEENGYPLFLNDYMSGYLSIETLIILDSFTDFMTKFDAKLKDDFLWSKFRFKARKYAPFLLKGMDRKKFANIIKESIYANTVSG